MDNFYWTLRSLYYMMLENVMTLVEKNFFISMSFSTIAGNNACKESLGGKDISTNNYICT